VTVTTTSGPLTQDVLCRHVRVAEVGVLRHDVVKRL
jgi:hypothetical protein